MEIKKIQDYDFKLIYCSENGLSFKNDDGDWFTIPDNFIFKIDLFDNYTSFQQICNLDISYFFTNINSINYFRISLMNKDDNFIEVLVNQEVYNYNLFFEEKKKNKQNHILSFLEFMKSVPFDEKHLVLYQDEKLNKLFLDTKENFLKTQPLKIQAEKYLKMINGCSFSIKKEKEEMYNKAKNNTREHIKVYVDGSYDIIEKHKKASIKSKTKKTCNKLNKMQIDELSRFYDKHNVSYNEDILDELYNDKVQEINKKHKRKNNIQNKQPVIKKVVATGKVIEEKNIDADFVLDNSNVNTQTLFPKDWFQ